MIDPTAFDNADFIPDGHSYFHRWPAAAAAFRSALPEARQRLDRRHGPGERERHDLFLPVQAPRGLLIFIHGGFWQMCDRRDYSHLAGGALAHGWAVALPSYPLAPAARIADITRSVARALIIAASEIDGPILIAGHSAGGHLALRMACADVALPDTLRARIAGILAISPLADLAPLVALPMNVDLRLDAAEAASESPVTHAAPVCKVEIEVGSAERPAFLDQAHRLAEAWPPARLTLAEGRHHFDVIDPLADAESDMIRRLLAMART